VGLGRVSPVAPQVEQIEYSPRAGLWTVVAESEQVEVAVVEGAGPWLGSERVEQSLGSVSQVRSLLIPNHPVYWWARYGSSQFVLFIE
jgi:hypothetical protein